MANAPSHLWKLHWRWSPGRQSGRERTIPPHQWPPHGMASSRPSARFGYNTEEGANSSHADLTREPKLSTAGTRFQVMRSWHRLPDDVVAVMGRLSARFFGRRRTGEQSERW